MAVTEYVVVSITLLAGLLGLYGFPVVENKSLLALMGEALANYLGAVTLSLSLP